MKRAERKSKFLKKYMEKKNREKKKKQERRRLKEMCVDTSVERDFLPMLSNLTSVYQSRRKTMGFYVIFKEFQKF
jgi:hypothetical protein